MVSGGRRGFWRAVTANRKVTLGLIVVVFFTLLAIFGPFGCPTSAPSTRSERTAIGRTLLGTTAYGRDAGAGGGRGARLGAGLLHRRHRDHHRGDRRLVSGYVGGWLTGPLPFSNVFLVLPALPLAIVLASRSFPIRVH